MFSWFSDELKNQRSMQMMQQGGGGVRSNNGCSSDRSAINNGKRSVHRENDTDVPTSAEARLFSAAADEYLGISSFVSDMCSSGGNVTSSQAEDEHKGKELFFCDDWPQLDSFMDFQEHLIRDFDSTFELGGDNYFQDPLWPSICSLDAQIVPSSHFDSPRNPDTASTQHVFIDQISTVSPINTQQPHGIEAGDDEEIERFQVHSSDGDLFCPLSHMLVPASPSMVCCSDHEIASSTSTACSGPDQLVAGYAPGKHSRDPSHATPDMILDGMAANPLEMYFPSLTAYEQQPDQTLMMNDGGLADQETNKRLFSEDFAVAVSGSENSRSPLIILEAARVKHLGFHKLQEGMNQLDVETKTCIRDALYRLANNVEQRHCVTQQLVAGAASSGPNRLRSGVWTEMQASPMDRSVAQLLLQKPPCRTTTTTGCQAKHVAR